MKILLILSLSFVMISCGGDPTEGDLTNSIGELRELNTDDKLSKSEKNNLESACTSLETKESIFKRNMVDTGKEVAFTMNSSNCSGEASGSEIRNLTVTLTNNKLIYEGDAHFSEVVTPQSEIVKDSCALTQESEDIQRAISLGNLAQWYTVFKGQDVNCNGVTGDDKEICVLIETGRKQTDSNSYTISDVEMYKIDIDTSSNSYGMVVDRIFATNTGCSKENSEQVKQQKFKQFN